MAQTATRHEPPALWLTLTEGVRAAMDIAGYGAMRWALEHAPRGDGHPVLVLPGFMADDRSTQALRGFLKGRGYQVFGWEMGQNTGPSDPDFGDRLGERVEDIVTMGQENLSIVGQSLGGVYAREIARYAPEAVRQVITLGSPLAGSGGTARLVEDRYKEMAGEGEGGGPPSAQPLLVPSTSIYSELDGIVSWKSSLLADHPQAENIGVYASHLGMAFSPSVLFIVAERLAQKPDDWRKFELSLAQRAMLARWSGGAFG